MLSEAKHLHAHVGRGFAGRPALTDGWDTDRYRLARARRRTGAAFLRFAFEPGLSRRMARSMLETLKMPRALPRGVPALQYA